jgi:hypothetical protein
MATTVGEPSDEDFPAVFARVSEQFLREFSGDEYGRMLHSPGLKTAGKFYGFASADDLVVKVPEARVDELVVSGQGLPCSPRPGRAMREWVRIPSPDAEACRAYLLEARAFLASAAAGPRA